MFGQFSKDVINHVSNWLDSQSVGNLMQTCKENYEYLKNSPYWNEFTFTQNYFPHLVEYAIKHGNTSQKLIIKSPLSVF